MNMLNPEMEVLYYLREAAKNSYEVTENFLYDKFGHEIIAKLIVDSYIAYGPYDTFILTDIGEELINSPLGVNNNYTKPDETGHIDETMEWLASSLIFANAIGKLLRENEGIVIKLQNDMTKLSLASNTDHGKVIVYNHGKQIHIVNCDDDLADGTMIWMHHEK